MAYVVRRASGRFEIRESVQSENGPRARTLANFAALTSDFVRRAERRAIRPFDPSAVVASALRCGATVEAELLSSSADASRQWPTSRFVEASRRFAAVAGAPGPRAIDSGGALAELISFAEEVVRHQPRRPVAPLSYPNLARLASQRRDA